MKKLSLILLVSLICSAYPLQAQNRSVWVGASLDAAAEPNAAGHACGLLSTNEQTYSITCLSARGGADGFTKPIYDVTQGIAQLVTRQGRVDVYALAGGGVSTTSSGANGLFEGGLAFGTRIVKGVDVVLAVKGAWSPSLEDSKSPRFALGFRFQP